MKPGDVSRAEHVGMTLLFSVVFNWWCLFPLVRSVTIWTSGSHHTHRLGTVMYQTDIMFPLVTSVWTDGSLHTHDCGTVIYQTDTVFALVKSVVGPITQMTLVHAPVLWDPLHT